MMNPRPTTLYAHRCRRLWPAALVCAGLLAGATPHSAPAAPIQHGLFPADLFAEVAADDAEGLASAAGLWYFRGEWVGVPRPELGPDERARLPPIVWVAAPERVEGARIELSDGERNDRGDRRVRLADGTVAALDVVAPVSGNELYVGPSTFDFYAERTVRMRGETVTGPDGPRFVARTIWPEDARIPWRSLRAEPLVAPEGLDDLVQAQASHWPSTRLLWERAGEDARHGRQWAGLPVLAIVLSGAQGDAPGSHAGHLAVATGFLGADGQWADWLANNIYPLEPETGKHISPGPVPMDNYLTDLNSGQALYRPVYVLVAVLGTPEVSETVQAAFHDFFERYWCHGEVFRPARNNSTEMSLDTLRAVGWEVPRVGGTSWWKGLAAAIGTAVVTFDPELTRQAWGYFTEERTDLLPRVAFEVMAEDLLALVAQAPPRELTALETVLGRETEAVLFLRFPQIPSTRPFGTYPVESIRGYRTRVGLRDARLDGADATEKTPPLPEWARRACER